MAIGRMPGARQEELFIAASAVRALDNPFYAALDKLLRESGFDEFAEETCREFYAERMGRPGLPPGVYFRMLMAGYLEGIGSERGIAWRCRDSISLREFLGYGLAKTPPEHSTLSKTRKRLSLEAHGSVFDSAPAHVPHPRYRSPGIDPRIEGVVDEPGPATHDGRRRHRLAAGDAGRDGAAAGEGGSGAEGSGGRQGLPLERDHDGGEGPRAAQLRERAESSLLSRLSPRTK